MLQPTDMIALLGSQLGDQRSHPDKLLHEHLQNVATLAKELASSHGLVVDEQLLTAIALTHDIGKVHPKFQRLLDGVGPVLIMLNRQPGLPIALLMTFGRRSCLPPPYRAA